MRVLKFKTAKKSTRLLYRSCFSSVAMLGLLSVYQHAAQAAEAPTVTRAPAPVEHVFVPQGFDDNDNAEIIIQGRFPNACMKTGPVEKSIDTQKRTIRLRPQVYVYRGEPCAQVIIPFTQRVTFGTLKEGTWRIEVEGMPSVAPLPLVVSRARTAAPDDYLYAPVEDVVLLPGALGSQQKLVLSGNWPLISGSGCFALKRIQTDLGADNTLVVRPIAELQSADQCDPSSLRKRAFQSTVNLEAPLKVDSLIHVRVLNGESLNKFYEAL
ncbi:hypothetical protein EBU99_08660 [bacterium]|nr:hypothetical protein [bacterium]